jgi:hypothetical protein
MKNQRRRREDYGNRISRNDRILASFIAVGALAIGYDTLNSGNATFVERRGLFRVLFDNHAPLKVTLNGWTIYWIFIVLVMIALTALTFIFDHYDRKFNASFYIALRRLMLVATFIFVGFGLVAAFTEISNS